MAARKTPILLRPAPLSGEIMALYRYTRKNVRGRDVIDCGSEGRWPVTADFDNIMLDALMEDAPDITAALDGAAKGMELDDDERDQIRKFREALIVVIERHNTKGHGKRGDD